MKSVTAPRRAARAGVCSALHELHLRAGEFDHVAEQAFFNIGGLEDLERNWARIQKEYGA